MIELYWGCLIGGAAFALLTLLVGDHPGGGHHVDHDAGGFSFLKPAVIVTAVAAFGGAGLFFSSTITVSSGVVAVLAACAAILVAVAVYFLTIRPMMRSENSVGFSMQELPGRLGEVITTIPVGGHGEVLIRIGASNTFHTAAGVDDREIRTGTRIVVVEVDRSRVLVAPVEDD